MTKRILYLIETLGHGGAEHQLVATVRRLDRRHFQPIVCHFRAPAFLAQELLDAGIEVRSLDAPPGKASWPSLTMRVRDMAREVRADLIHTSLLEADVIGGVAGKLAKVPVISTLCNIAGDPIRLADNPRNSRLKFATTNLIWGAALRHLHRHSVAISRAVKDSATTTFGMDPGRLSVIYRGIDADQRLGATDKAAARARLGFADASPLLLSVGRLAPQKGHQYLIAALPRLLAEFPKARLLLVGEGWLKPTLEAQIAGLRLGPHVTFLGKRTDVPELFAASDVFVFPSLFEGLGVSLLEAGYAGSACLASDVGPIPEIIDDQRTGLLVPRADSSALAAALLRMARDPALRERLGAAARARVLDRFMLPDKVTELQALYSRLLPNIPNG